MLIRTTRKPPSRGPQRAAAAAGTLAVAALIAFAGTGAASAAIVPDAAGAADTIPTTTVTFNYTGTAQTWTVPAGVTSVRATAIGGQGGSGGNVGYGSGSGGYGASVTATLPVTDGEQLSIQVAGSGGGGTLGGGGAPGYGGGGNGSNSYLTGGGGGGASTVSQGSTPLTVAAGGGGGGAGGTGNGGAAGQPGAAAGSCGGGGGGSGQSTQGGLGGIAGCSDSAGSAGTSEQGGDGGGVAGRGQGGGGGGGGYNGGGGGGGGGYNGGSGGGGGGGSSYAVDPNATIQTDATGQPEVQITYALQTQSISFTSTPPASAVYGGSYQVTATATSGLPVTFSVDPSSTAGACTLSGATVSFTGPGQCVIDANQAGNPSYTPAPQVSQAITVGQAPQAISFTSTPPAAPTVGGSYTVTATGGASGNPVTFSIDSASTAGACSLSGNTVSFTGTGQCVIDANQVGNTDYAAAPQVSHAITVVPARADLKISLSTPAQAADGSSLNETVTVTNLGPATASKVITALTEPAGLTVTNADGASVQGPILTWKATSLAPGASLTYTVTAKVGADAHATVALAVGTLSGTKDPNLMNNAAISKLRLG